MKILKKIAFGLAALAVLFLVVALFIDGSYHVEKSITVNKPQAEVYGFIKYLKNQDKFSKWQMMDPKMKKHFSGTDATIGFVAGWKSDNEQVGVGEQEIVKISPTRIDYELRFKEPFEATDNAYMSAEAMSENSTEVKWGFDGKMSYPTNFFMLFMDMEEMIGGDLESGLNNLKNYMEE